jgi:hypothetical protein
MRETDQLHNCLLVAAGVMPSTFLFFSILENRFGRCWSESKDALFIETVLLLWGGSPETIRLMRTRIKLLLSGGRFHGAEGSPPPSLRLSNPGPTFHGPGAGG